MVLLKFKSTISGHPDFEQEFEEEKTVLELKQLIAPRVGLTEHTIRLVRGGRVFEDPYPLTTYAPHTGDIHVLNNPAGAPKAAPTALPGANPLGMDGMPDPEQMAAMMNNPMVEAMMNSPDMMQAIFNSNPQLQQLIQSNPEIGRLLQDPEVMQQSMRAMRNPQMMREMMRGADRSMANLDTIPGGYNALRRMHEEIADPMYEAMTNRGGAAGSNANQEYEQQTAPANEAMPNPWASNNAAPKAGAMPKAPGGIPGLGMGGFPGGLAGLPKAPAPGGAVGPPPPNPFASLFGPGAPGGMGAMGAPGAAGGMGGMGGAPGANPFANLMGAGGLAGGGLGGPPDTITDFDLTLKVKWGPNNSLANELEQHAKQSMKVIELKRALSPRVGYMPPSVMRIMSKGREWKDDEAVSEYGHVDNDTIHILQNSSAGDGATAGSANPMFAGGLGNRPNIAAMLQGMNMGAAPGGAPAPGMPGANPGMNPFLAAMAAQGGAGGAAPPADPRPPRERYAAQLQQLLGMGIEEDRALAALEATNGDVNAAMGNLFGA